MMNLCRSFASGYWCSNSFLIVVLIIAVAAPVTIIGISPCTLFKALIVLLLRVPFIRMVIYIYCAISKPVHVLYGRSKFSVTNRTL